MKLTTQQLSFVDRLCQTASGIALKAVAGSGKTTTLVEGVKALLDRKPQRKVGCVAFNKRNAEDLAKKMPGAATSMTMNSMGHRAWMRMARGRISLDANKTWEIAKQMFSFEDRQAFPDLARFVSTLKMAKVVPQGSPNGPLNDEESLYSSILEDHMLEYEVSEKHAIFMAREVLKESIRQAWAGNIDFDDQLFMPVVNRAPFPRFDTLLVDEAQDLNSIQHDMLAAALGPNGQLIAVGDPHQAIYGFRGADTKSMGTMTERFGLEEMDLSFCFRCPKSVVARAQRWVPHIQAPENAPEGEVIEGGDLSGIEGRSAVLSRYNRHLVPVAFGLIRKGIPATILGAEIGKSLAKLVEKHGIGGNIENVLDALERHCKREAKHYMDKGKEAQARTWFERFEVIALIAQWSGANSNLALQHAILRLFSNQQSLVTCSTIHKAKGMEWRQVHFVAPELVPAPWAVKRGGWELEQENNIAYVGTTRAQHQLILVPEEHLEISPAGFEFKPEPKPEDVSLEDLLGEKNAPTK